jgi:CBS domain-containing protein
MVTVRQILDEKPSDLWTIQPGATVYEALELMAAKEIGALLVVRDGKLCGLFSERDYARKVILKGKTSRTTQVAELMSVNLLVVRPDQTVDACMALMTNKRFRHLPVLEEGRLIGLVSIGDLVRKLISEKEFVIQELEHYIQGEYQAPECSP